MRSDILSDEEFTVRSGFVSGKLRIRAGLGVYDQSCRFLLTLLDFPVETCLVFFPGTLISQPLQANHYIVSLASLSKTTHWYVTDFLLGVSKVICFDRLFFLHLRQVQHVSLINLRVGPVSSTFWPCFALRSSQNSLWAGHSPVSQEVCIEAFALIQYIINQPLS